MQSLIVEKPTDLPSHECPKNCQLNHRLYFDPFNPVIVTIIHMTKEPSFYCDGAHVFKSVARETVRPLAPRPANNPYIKKKNRLLK